MLDCHAKPALTTASPANALVSMRARDGRGGVDIPLGSGALVRRGIRREVFRQVPSGELRAHERRHRGVEAEQVVAYVVAAPLPVVRDVAAEAVACGLRIIRAGVRWHGGYGVVSPGVNRCEQCSYC